MKKKTLVPLIVFLLGMCLVGLIVYKTDAIEKEQKRTTAQLNATTYGERIKNEIHTVSDCSHENNHILYFSRFPGVRRLLSEKWERRLLRMDVPLQILRPREYIVFQIDNFLPCCLSLLLTFHSIKYSTFPQQNPDTLRMHPQDP